MKAKKIEWGEPSYRTDVVNGLIEHVFVGRIVKLDSEGIAEKFELQMRLGNRSCPVESIEKGKEIAQDYMDEMLNILTIN